MEPLSRKTWRVESDGVSSDCSPPSWTQVRSMHLKVLLMAEDAALQVTVRLQESSPRDTDDDTLRTTGDTASVGGGGIKCLQTLSSLE